MNCDRSLYITVYKKINMFIIKTFNMTLARICVTLFLLVYSKFGCGQQYALSNIAAGLCPNNNIAGLAQQILQRRSDLLSESKNCNKNINGNAGTTTVQQPQTKQARLLHGNLHENNQLGNCQQQNNLQQAIITQLPLNLQQSAFNQNQQNVQHSQAQNIKQLKEIPNPQKCVVQNQCVPNQSLQISSNPSCQQSQNLQQNGNWQPQTSTLLSNSPQSLGHSVMPQSDISLASVVNRQDAGLPTQVSEGTLLSHVGIQPSLPALLPHMYGPKQSVDQACMVKSNCPSNLNNDVSTALFNNPQKYALLSSMASQQLQKGFLSSNPTTPMLRTTYQNPPIHQQVELLQNTQQNIIPAQNQLNQYIPGQQQFPVQNQISTPAQYQPVKSPAQIQSIPSSVHGQPVMTSVQSNSIQNQPIASIVQPAQVVTSVPYESTPQVQSQLTYSSLPVRSNPMVLTQHSTVPMSQYPQSPNEIPQCPNDNIPSFQNNLGNTKASNIKQLLPLLFNLLKEKSCCGCHQNQNCGCMNNNNPMFTNQPPQIVGGYSHYVKNVPAVVNTAANMIDSEEEDDYDTVWRLEKKRSYKESKTRHEDSTETDEDDEDSAEVETDNQEQ